MAVRVGIIGTGWVAVDRHLPSYRRHPQARLAAVLDRRPERAREVAAREGIPVHVSRMEDLLEVGLDAVSICTPPWTHAELACAALGSGLHVFCEKPMALDEHEAQAMADAARANDRILCVSHNFVFSRAVRRADQVLAGDTVRHGFAVQLSSLRRRLPSWHHELPGGLLLDESPHVLYVLQHFLGGLELDGVRASPADAGEVPAATEIRLQGRTGMAQVTMLFGTPVSEWHVALVGERRCVDLDLFRDIATVAASDGAHQPLDVLRTSSRAVLGHAAGFVTSGARYVAGRQFWGHDRVIGRFVDAVAGGGPSPVPVDDALGVVRLTDAVLAELGVGRRPR